MYMINITCDSSYWEGCGARKTLLHCYTIVGVQSCVTTVEINVVVAQKIGNQSISRLNYTLLGTYPKNMPSYLKDTCLTKFIAVLFKNWKQSRYFSSEDWIKKTRCIYTMENFTAVKEK